MSRQVVSSLLLMGLLIGCGSEDPKPDPQTKPTTTTQKDWSRLIDAQADEAVLDGRPVLVAGQPGSASYEVCRGMAKANQAAVVPTAGSLEALAMVAWGLGDVAVVRDDVLQDPRNRNLAAQVKTLKPLYMEEIHVLVPQSAPTQKLAELFGKRVAVGLPGSGDALTAGALLDAAEAFETTRVHHPLARALDALAKGEVDAAIVVGGSPIARLLKERRCRLLDLAKSGELDATLERLQKRNPNYAAVDVSYDTVGSGKTIGIPALLVADAEDAKAAGMSWSPSGEHHPKGASSAGSTGPAPGGPSVAYRDPKAPMRMAAGAANGGYAKVAQGLARALDGAGASLTPIETAGSLQNLLLVASGQAELALVQEDLLLEALASPRTARLLARVRVVTPLFPEQVHLVRGGGASVDSLAALRGKRVALGAPGSGSLMTAARLLRLARIDANEVQARTLSASAALDAVRGGKLDAAFLVGSQPLPALAKGGLPLVALSEVKGYTATEIPAEAYPGQSEAVATLATRAVLICRFDLEDEQVKALTTLVFANRKNLATLHPQVAKLDPAWLDALPEGLKLHAGVTAAKGDLKPDAADPW